MKNNTQLSLALVALFVFLGTFGNQILAQNQNLTTKKIISVDWEKTVNNFNGAGWYHMQVIDENGNFVIASDSSGDLRITIISDSGTLISAFQLYKSGWLENFVKVKNGYMLVTYDSLYILNNNFSTKHAFKPSAINATTNVGIYSADTFQQNYLIHGYVHDYNLGKVSNFACLVDTNATQQWLYEDTLGKINWWYSPSVSVMSNNAFLFYPLRGDTSSKIISINKNGTSDWIDTVSYSLANGNKASLSWNNSTIFQSYEPNQSSFLMMDYTGNILWKKSKWCNSLKVLNDSMLLGISTIGFTPGGSNVSTSLVNFTYLLNDSIYHLPTYRYSHPDSLHQSEYAIMVIPNSSKLMLSTTVFTEHYDSISNNWYSTLMPFINVAKIDFVLDSLWNVKIKVDSGTYHVKATWNTLTKRTTCWTLWDSAMNYNCVIAQRCAISLNCSQIPLDTIHSISANVGHSGMWYYSLLSDDSLWTGNSLRTPTDSIYVNDVYIPSDSIWNVQSSVDTSTSMVTITYQTKLKGNTNVDAYHWNPFMNVYSSDTTMTTNHSVTFYAPKLGIYEYGVYSKNEYGVTTYSYGIYNRYTFTTTDTLPVDSIYDVYITTDTVNSIVDINWKTVYNADSRMWAYSAHNMNSSIWQDDATMVTNHSMSIRFPKTGKYELNLESVDMYGRDLQYRTFIIMADTIPFDSITNVSVVITDTAKRIVTLSWDNLQLSTYAFTAIDFGAISNFKDDTTKTKHHSFTFTVSDTGYWNYELYAENEYNNNYAYQNSFYMPDTIPKIHLPVVKDSLWNAEGNVDSGTYKAHITWETRFPATSYVKLLDIDSNITEISDTTMTQHHTLDVTLPDSGGYYGYVESIDSLGDTLTANIWIYAKDTAIYQDSLYSINHGVVYEDSTTGDKCITISWKSSLKSTSYAIATMYWKGSKFSSGYSGYNSDTTMVTDHSITLCGLITGWYRYTVVSEAHGKKWHSSGLDSFYVPKNCWGGSLAPVIVEKKDTSSDVIFHLNVFPNPSNGIINLEISVSGILLLYDMSGKLLISESTKEGLQSIDISHLAKGHYLYRFIHSDEVTNGKIILK